MHFARLKELYVQKKYPILHIQSGMFLELHENVGEGDTKRIQKFKGLVIQVKKPNNPNGTFTIRGTIAGVVVEKIFPLSFTKFEKVILLDQFATRRARINYIREKVGKGAKMKSIITVDRKEIDLLAIARGIFGEDVVVTPTEEVATETPAVENAVVDTVTTETPVVEESNEAQEKITEEKVESVDVVVETEDNTPQDTQTTKDA